MQGGGGGFNLILVLTNFNVVNELPSKRVQIPSVQDV